MTEGNIVRREPNHTPKAAFQDLCRVCEPRQVRIPKGGLNMPKTKRTVSALEKKALKQFSDALHAIQRMVMKPAKPLKK